MFSFQAYYNTQLLDNFKKSQLFYDKKVTEMPLLQHLCNLFYFIRIISALTGSAVPSTIPQPAAEQSAR